MEVLIAYIPVLHDGYRKLLAAHPNAEVFVFGPEIIAKFDYLKKEIRALDPELVVKGISAWGIVKKVGVLDLEKLAQLQKKSEQKDFKIIMSDEDVTHALADEYFTNNKVYFENIFLRWDKHNALQEKPVVPDEMISRSGFDKKMMVDLEKEAQKSSDWWRRIASAVVNDGKILLVAHNEHVPSNHTPYINGDPRNAFKKGMNIEISSSMHSESRLVSEAARRGISLEGASMYVTVFPCPPCAKSIAFSGIKTLYCAGGYAVLDGEEVLRSQGIKIIFVETDESSVKKDWEGYKK